MRIPVSLLVVGLIFAEIAAFILVGQAIGVVATLALILLGMVTGAVLLRRAGTSTLMRMRTDAAAHKLPVRALFDGAAAAVAALLLMLPGFITDVLALLLLVPASRNRLWSGLSGRYGGDWRRAPHDFPRHGEVIDLPPRDYASDRRSDSPWRQRENGVD
jgi:UPF0716 protein FxsA